MTGGLIALVAVLVVASAAGFALRARQGKFRPAGSPSAPSPAGDVLSADELGAPLGAKATLVQFSAEVCAYCGPTRALLAQAARERDGVAFIEIDAAQRMDLTRRLHVLATPTVLVLDALGAVSSRASGPLGKVELTSAMDLALSSE